MSLIGLLLNPLYSKLLSCKDLNAIYSIQDCPFIVGYTKSGPGRGSYYILAKSSFSDRYWASTQPLFSVKNL